MSHFPNGLELIGSDPELCSLTSSLSCFAPEVASPCGSELHGSDDRQIDPENPATLPRGRQVFVGEAWRAPSASRGCASEQRRSCPLTVRLSEPQGKHRGEGERRAAPASDEKPR